jgi:hypothetical protein
MHRTGQRHELNLAIECNHDGVRQKCVALVKVRVNLSDMLANAFALIADENAVSGPLG